MSLHRRQFLGSLGVTTLALAQGQTRRPPNIVYIMADDLGYGDLGCYGQKIIKTPNIDRLAIEGTRFTQAYAGCTVCAPSRSVLMTGLHMGHTSVRSNPGGVPIRPEDVTVAEYLKKAGYATGCFGKWGLGDNGTDGVPWKHGFDEFFGYLNQVHAHFFYPEFLYANDKRYHLSGNENGKRTTYSHDVIGEKAREFIRRNADKPFFAYMPFTLPHLELLVPDDSIAPYRGKLEEKPYTTAQKHYADQPESRAAYAGMVSRLDRDVGRVLDLLRELKLEANTLVFFTSDNGSAVPLWGEDYFGSTAGLRGHKQNMYEGGIRVPMIARWPGHVPVGKTSDHPWGFWDILPTFCDVAGIKPPSGIDGASVLPALLGRKQPQAEFMYWELPRYNAKTGQFRKEIPMQAVRNGDWKAVRPTPDAPLELYNLREDPQEKNNRASTDLSVMKRLEAYLAQARTEPRPQPDPPQDFTQR